MGGIIEGGTIAQFYWKIILDAIIWSLQHVGIGVVSSPNFLLQFPSPNWPPFSLSFLLVSPKSHHLSFPPLSSLVLAVPLVQWSWSGCGYKEKVPISEYGPHWVPILCVKLAVTLQAMVACFKPMMAGRIRYGLWWKHFYSLQWLVVVDTDSAGNIFICFDCGCSFEYCVMHTV